MNCKSSENIFKLIKNKSDKHCNILKDLCHHQKCFYDKDQNNNVIKICDGKNIIEWETIVYLYLIDTKITTLFSISNMTIEYNTCDKITLYEYIIKNKLHIKLILNELVSFVSKFRQYSFLHGNLHIYNIFVNPNKFPGIFYVIDLANSFLYLSTFQPLYKRSSFLGEIDTDDQILFEYWDFFTLYISLKPLLTSENFFYFEKLVRNYIREDILNIFLIKYESYIKNKLVKPIQV